MTHKTSFKMTKLVLLLGVIMLLGINYASSQTPQQDLSPGNFKIMNKPFQIEALVFPNIKVNGVLFDTFSPEFYTLSNFTSFWVAHSDSELEDYPIEVQDKPWSRLENKYDGLTSFELTKVKNLFRSQFADDNLSPYATDLVTAAKNWFDYKNAKSEFNNTILSVDLPASYLYQKEDLNNMLSLLKPDLILFNRYPWEKNVDYNYVQILYGWYGQLVYFRNIALNGNGNVSKPIPFGAFTQTWFANQSTPPSRSQTRLNCFGSLAFGAKMLSAFVFNDYPANTNYTIVSTLFNETPLSKSKQPTNQFWCQAEINQQVTNIGPALLQLQTSDIRFIPKARTTSSIYLEGYPIATLNWTEAKERPDAYLTKVSATGIATVNNENGDVLVGYFKPVHKSLDGTNTTNENYFMIVNGFYANDTVSSFQNIRLNFNFGELTHINSLLRISRLTGKVEVVPLIKENTAGNEYHLDLLLNGGEGDLFKYNNGVPFVGFPGLISLNENTISDKNVLLYPNPVNDILYVKLPENNNRFLLYDIVGNKVYDQHIPDDYQLDMSNFNTGIYFFKAENAKGTICSKVIKK